MVLVVYYFADEEATMFNSITRLTSLMNPYVLILCILVVASCTSLDVPDAPSSPNQVDVVGLATAVADTARTAILNEDARAGYADPAGKFEALPSSVKLRAGQLHDVSFTVAGDIIYKYGYVYKAGAWQKIEYTGPSYRSSDWISGKAEVRLSLNLNDFPEDAWVIAYACKDTSKRSNGKIVWDCNKGQWILRVVPVVPDVPFDPLSPIEEDSYSDAVQRFTTKYNTGTLTLSHTDYLVFKYGYIWKNGKWQQFEYLGDMVPGTNWITKKSEASIQIDPKDFVPGTNWVLSYGCSLSDKDWDCHGGRWLIQTFSLPGLVQSFEKLPTEVSVSDDVKKTMFYYETTLITALPRYNGIGGQNLFNPKGVKLTINVPLAAPSFSASSMSNDVSSWSTLSDPSSAFRNFINVNEWHHLAATYDGKITVLYFDGVPLSRATSEQHKIRWSDDDLGFPNPGQIYIGGSRSSQDGDDTHADTNFFAGGIDEVRIYTRALSDGDIKALYDHPDKTSGDLGNSLLAYWNLDDIRSGVQDATFNHNDGISYGARRVEGKIGKALYFDGESDYLAFNLPPQIRVTNSVSVSLWVNLGVH